MPMPNIVVVHTYKDSSRYAISLMAKKITKWHPVSMSSSDFGSGDAYIAMLINAVRLMFQSVGTGETVGGSYSTYAATAISLLSCFGKERQSDGLQKLLDLLPTTGDVWREVGPNGKNVIILQRFSDAECVYFLYLNDDKEIVCEGMKLWDFMNGFVKTGYYSRNMLLFRNEVDVLSPVFTTALALYTPNGVCLDEVDIPMGSVDIFEMNGNNGKPLPGQIWQCDDRKRTGVVLNTNASDEYADDGARCTSFLYRDYDDGASVRFYRHFSEYHHYTGKDSATIEQMVRDLYKVRFPLADVKDDMWIKQNNSTYFRKEVHDMCIFLLEFYVRNDRCAMEGEYEDSMTIASLLHMIGYEEEAERYKALASCYHECIPTKKEPPYERRNKRYPSWYYSILVKYLW